MGAPNMSTDMKPKLVPPLMRLYHWLAFEELGYKTSWPTEYRSALTDDVIENAMQYWGLAVNGEPTKGQIRLAIDAQMVLVSDGFVWKMDIPVSNAEIGLATGTPNLRDLVNDQRPILEDALG
jgi:hypothetical protein